MTIAPLWSKLSSATQKALKLFSEGQLIKAYAALEVIQLKGGHDASLALRYLAHMDIQNRRYALALSRLERASLLAGPDPKVLTQLAEVTMQLGDYERAVALVQEALTLNPDNPVLELNHANWINSRSTDPVAIRQRFEAWSRKHLDPLRQLQPPLVVTDRRQSKKLKIGYVSGDLKNHAVRYFIEPYLKLHDRQNFEVHAYMTTPGDAITQILRDHVEHWHEVQSLSSAALCEQIRNQGIDILVDLSGHTEGGRLEVFARRAAPVQITWWGFVQTLGMQEMDYRLTDAVNCPPGTDPHYTEQLCRMDCLTAYNPPLNCEAVYDSPWKTNGHVTMVSLNHSRKISDQCLALWSRILERNPNSGLIVVCSERDQESVDALFQQRLRAQSIPAERIALVPRLSLLDFMGLASIADFSLDTLPISGGVTSFHALWMGLPVLTLKPSQAIALQAYSSNILTTVGMNDCIAGSPEDYVERAGEWINHPDTIDRLRSRCRPSLQASPFMDHRGRVRELEQHFRRLWTEYLAQA